MGVWGEGNFDNDGAGDFLDEVFTRFHGNIEAVLSKNDDDAFEGLDDLLMPSADIIITLSEKYDTSPLLEEEKVEKWKRKCLKLYDDIIDQYGAKEPYKQNRRKVIEETFNKLITLCLKYPL